MDLGKNILIVEDEHVIALDIKHSLEEMGHKVSGSVPSGEEAIDFCKARNPDLVLMDIKLKGKIDGIQAAVEIGNNPRIPIVFLTSFADEETLRRATLTKHQGYLLKPFDRQELQSTIAKAISQIIQADKSPALDIDPQGRLAEQTEGLDGRAAFLSSHQLFAGVESTQITWLAKLAQERQFDVGDFILTRGKPIDAGFIVVSGRISVMRTSPTGKDLIVSLLAPGDSFGMCYLISDLGKSLSGRAQSPSRLLYFPKSNHEEILTRIPQLPIRIAAQLATLLQKSYGLATSLAYESVEDRIVSALVNLVSDFGKHADRPNESWVYITRKELADLTGTTPETAIRITKNLERAKLLDLTRPGIIKIPNIAALRALGIGDNQ
jgi:CRP-like cAMP-binding protein/CheY-like chemotaxis protein